MDEYTASLEDVRMTYVFDNPVAAYDLEVRERRERAFDRLVRQIQDESFEDGYNQHGWEMM